MPRVMLLLMALTLTGCGVREPMPIVIGQIAPLNGPQQVVGHNAMQGVRLAVQGVNNTDGQKLDRPIVVIHANAEGEQACRAEGIRLKQINQVTALLGGDDAREVAGLDQVGLPVVSPAGWHNAETGRMVFLTGLAPAFRGQILADFAAAQKPAGVSSLVGETLTPWAIWPLLTAGQLAAQVHAPERIVVLVDLRRKEFVQAAAAFTKRYGKKIAAQFPGQTVTSPLTWNYENDDQLAEHVKRLADEPASRVCVAGEVAAVQKLRGSAGSKSVPILFAGLDGSEAALLSVQGKGASIVLATAWVPDAATELNSHFVATYHKAFGEAPDVHAALAYDDARVLFEALRRCDRVYSSAEIQDKLAGLKDFPILTGNASFDDAGQLQRPAFLVRLQDDQATTIGRHDAK